LAKHRQRRPIARETAESRAADIATVAWMFSAMTTLACAGVAAIVWFFAVERGDGGQAILLARFLHFSALVTAVISLALTVVVLKIRQAPPPRSIVIAAVIVAVLPILVAFL
jgi:hypothetical protein